jgi:hypothetical protein
VASATNGATLIAAGTASGSLSDAANFHFELTTSPLPVPSPSAGVLLLPAARALCAVGRRNGVEEAEVRTEPDCS